MTQSSPAAAASEAAAAQASASPPPPTPASTPARDFALGVRDSFAIVLGYVPVAISFGLAASQAKIPAWLTVFASIMMFAGAAQFVLVALVATGASAWGIVTTAVLMNVRHLFYGPALLPKLALGEKHKPMLFLAAGLTDEVFAAAMGKLPHIAQPKRENWYIGLQLGSYAGWVSGSAIGALLGQQLGQQAPWMQNTLDFVFGALFFALLLELLSHSRWFIPAAAMLATALLLLVLPAHWAMIGGMVTGAAISALVPVPKNHFAPSKAQAAPATPTQAEETAP